MNYNQWSLSPSLPLSLPPAASLFLSHSQHFNNNYPLMASLSQDTTTFRHFTIPPTPLHLIPPDLLGLSLQKSLEIPEKSFRKRFSTSSEEGVSFFQELEITSLEKKRGRHRGPSCDLDIASVEILKKTVKNKIYELITLIMKLF